MLTDVTLFRSRQSRRQHDDIVAQRLFRDQFGEAYIQIYDENGILRTFPIKSEQFKYALIRLAVMKNRIAPSSSELRTVIETAAAFAEVTEPVTLFNRIAETDGCIYYNLGNQQREVVEITATGWRLRDSCPVHFRTTSIMGAQVKPIVQKSGIGKIFDFVNITDASARILFEVWLVSNFLPNIDHPIAAISGPAGSVKTTTAEIIKSTTDPSTAIDIGPFPNSETELAQLLSHNYMTVFDNLTQIKPNYSDLLCQAVTGGVFMKRKLYTDQGIVALPMRGCVVLTGINVTAEKPDLLDRMLVFPLEKISAEHRKGKKEVKAAFEECLPGILGAIFDALSLALAQIPNIHPEKLPRLADFYKAGIAISQALGHERGAFEGAFAENQKRLQVSAIDGNPLLQAVLAFMQNEQKWEGSATDLLLALNRMGCSNSLPKAPNQLTRKLREVEQNLRSERILVEWGRTAANVSHIKLQKD